MQGQFQYTYDDDETEPKELTIKWEGYRIPERVDEDTGAYYPATSDMTVSCEELSEDEMELVREDVTAKAWED